MEQDIQQKNKIGFFTRIKFAIFKLEDYGMFLGENLKVAIKYFFVLILLVSVIVAVATTYDFYNVMNRMKNYIENELPEFTYEEGILNFSSQVDAYDEKYDFRLIINTSESIDEKQISEYKGKVNEFGMILLKDKVIFLSNGTELEETYLKLLEGYNISINNKTDLENQISNPTINNLIGIAFIYNFIALFVSNIISTISDILILSIFGWIASRLCNINFKIRPIIVLAIYSLTLSIVLATLYTIVYMFTGFYIEYFNIIYLLIAYIYMVAAIFMIKYDFMKQTEELQKIIEVQEKIMKDMEEDEKEENENKEKDNDKKDDRKSKEKDDKNNEEEPSIEPNREPDGSEI